MVRAVHQRRPRPDLSRLVQSRISEVAKGKMDDKLRRAQITESEYVRRLILVDLGIIKPE